MKQKNKNKQLSFALEFATNMFGRISPDIKKRLEAVIKNPNQKTWEDTHCIILNNHGRGLTLWQAVCKIDWMFPHRKPLDEAWEKIPSRETILDAIRYAVMDEKNNPTLN